METASRTFTVPASLDGARLDKAVVTGFSLSRARVKRAIEGRSVRVNGRVRAKGAVVAVGDVITVADAVENDAEAPATPEPAASLTIAYEAANVLVADKPAKQPTAPLRAGEVGTLANALAGRFPELTGIGAPREPGLVHRLDTDTSGLVVVARNAAAFAELKAALKGERLEKRYFLVCSGDRLPDAGTIEFPLASHPKDQRRVLACIHPRDVARNAPRPATTRYEVKQREGTLALVEVRVARALRHQIRAHFAALENPLLGDALYGGPTAPGLDRHALHASRVTYKGGATVAAFDVSSPLPPDMAALLSRATV